MSDELRVHFHFHSPYSRIGLHRLHLAKVTEKIPTRLFMLSHAAGTGAAPNPIATPARRAYIMEDVPRSTMQAGLPISLPNPMSPDYTLAAAAFYAAQDQGQELPFATALSNLRWGHGKDVSHADVIMEAAKDVGISFDPLSTDDVPARLAEDQQQVEKDGAFGVPFAVLDRDGKKEKFFGQDRFDLLLERLG